MATIASLNAIVGADVTGFTRALNRAEGRSRQFGRNSSRHFNQSSQAMQSMQRRAQTLQRAVTGLVAAFTVQRLVAFTRSTLESANALNDQARSLGVTTEALQRYRFAAASVGIEQQKLDRSLERFVRRVGEARQGGGELASVAEELNLSLNDPQQTFLQLANAMQRSGDAAEIARLSYAAFGREGLAMGRLLQQGGEAIQELAGQAEVLGDSLAAQAAELNTQFTLIRQNLEVAFQRGLLTEVVGEFGNFNEALNRNSAAAETWGRTAGQAFNAVANAARFLAENIEAVETAFGALVGMRIGAIFGPWGAAIGAVAGALLTLRSEADQTRDLLEQYSGAINSVENATRGLLHVTDERLAQLDAEQRELVESAQAELLRTQAAIAHMRTSTAAFRQEIERLQAFNILGIGDPILAPFNQALEAIVSFTDRQVDRAAELSQQIEDLLGIVGTSTNTGFVASFSAAADETERFSDEVNNLVRQLDPATARMQDLAAANDLLFEAWQAGVFGDPASEESLQRFNELTEAAARSIQDVGDVAESEASRIATVGVEAASIWAQAFDQVASSVARSFANMVFGLGSSFNFRQVGASILSQALTPVFQSLNPFASTVSGTSGFGNLSGIGSIFSPNAFSIRGFDPLVNSVNSLFGIGSPTSSISFGVNAIGNAISGTNIAPTSAGLFGLGSIGTAAGLGLASTAFGLLSGQGVGRSLLSGGLTAIGGAIGGPIGAAAGGILGGVFGGLFGGGAPPDSTAAYNFNPPTGSFNRAGSKNPVQGQWDALLALSEAASGLTQTVTGLGGQVTLPDLNFFLSGKYSDRLEILRPDGSRYEVNTGTQNDIAALEKLYVQQVIPTIKGLDDTLQEMLRNSGATTISGLMAILEADQASVGVQDQLRTAAMLESIAAGQAINQFLQAQPLSGLSSLSPTQRLAEAQSQFGANLDLVRGGDIQAVGALLASAETLLGFGRAQFASTVSFAALESSVRSSLAQVGLDITSQEAIADRTAAAVDLQTETLAEQNERIIKENEKIREELRGIKRAIEAQNEAA